MSYAVLIMILIMLSGACALSIVNAVNGETVQIRIFSMLGALTCAVGAFGLIYMHSDASGLVAKDGSEQLQTSRASK